MDEIFKLFKSKSSIVILSIILMSIKCKFFDLLKLSNGNYFIILDTGFYIYDNNFHLNKTLYTFNPKLDTCYNSKISEYLNNDEIYIIGFYDYAYYSNSRFNYSLYIYNYNKENFNLYIYLYGRSTYPPLYYFNSGIENLYYVNFEKLNVNVSNINDYIYYD